MKNSITTKLSILLIFSITLFSCGTNKNLGLFSKRKYTDGVFVHTKLNVAEPAQKNNSIAEREISAENVNASETTNLKVSNSNVESHTELASIKEESINLTPSIPAIKSKKENKMEKARLNINFQSLISSKNNSAKVESKKDISSELWTDAPSVVMVFLAFLMPPAAIYLKGNGTSKQFWRSIFWLILFPIDIIYAYMIIFNMWGLTKTQ